MVESVRQRRQMSAVRETGVPCSHAVLDASDGVRLYYEIEGDRPPPLLHLGAGCDIELWLAAGHVGGLRATHRCILFDHRGHGRSDHPAGPEANHIDRFVDDVIRLIDHLGLEQVDFCGYSNAISVGIKTAEGHPDRLRRLVMSGAIQAGLPTAEEVTASVAASIADRQEHAWDTLIGEFAAEEGPAPAWMETAIRATPLVGAIGWIESRPTWGWSTWEALPRVMAPTLYLVGELEAPDDEMAGVAARMPYASRVRIPGKGHINGFLDSTFVIPRVLAFLDIGALPADPIARVGASKNSPDS
jgi:pimeloyl-ACP methyl ester carboxylesterase